MNIEKYTSFVLALYIFYPVINLIFKIVGLDGPYMSIPFLLAGFPIVMARFRFFNVALLLPLFFIAWMVGNVLFSQVELDTVKHVVTLYLMYGLSTSYMAAQKFCGNTLYSSLYFFSMLNFLLLSYVALFRFDLYLDRDFIEYISFGYWMLSSAIVFTYRYSISKQWFDAALAGVSVLLLSFFGSRFALVAYLLAMIFWALSSRKLSLHRKWTFMVFGVAGGLFILVVGIDLLAALIVIAEGFDLPATNLYRLMKSITDIGASDLERLELFARSTTLISQFPLGVGLFGYHDVLLNGENGVFRYPHNLFLQLWLEFGLALGSVLLMAVCFCFFKLLRADDVRIHILSILLVSQSTKLLVSATYIWEPAFWMALVLGVRLIFGRERFGNVD